MNPTSKELISAVTEFYNFITKLPYVDPTAVLYPPNLESDQQQGWPDINAEELRKRGRTEEVIAVLRNLPYLRSPVAGKGQKGWMIGPDTYSIAYCDGEVYSEELDKIQPTPGHCIWLADPANTDDGAALLFDVENGTITEYTVHNNRTVCLDTNEYESLPREDRWMAHFTLPATVFFLTWTDKYNQLEWMPCLKGDNTGTATWFMGPQWKDDLLDGTDSEDSDESYEPSSEESDDDDYDSEDYDPYDYDSEYESDEIDDTPIDQDTLESEIAELKLDDGRDLAHQVGGYSRDRVEYEIRSGNTKLLTTNMPAVEEAVKKARSICIVNGWPDPDDRDECWRQLSSISKQLDALS